MSRLELASPTRADIIMEELYKDLERRIESSPPGLCPVDMARAFLELCHAQTCGKCVPCRIGLGQLNGFIKDVLDGNATMETLDIMEQTALSIMESADCAIGYEAARMVLQGVQGFRDDYLSHVESGRCLFGWDHPVPCVALCPAGVDIPKVFAIYNQYRIDHNEMSFRSTYGYLEEEKQAQHCVRCGKCMEHCPQHIQIPDRMEEIRDFAARGD